MSTNDPKDLSSLSITELFRMEVEIQGVSMTQALLDLERQADNQDNLNIIMRTAHSLKGAARIAGRRPVEKIAHLVEDLFSKALKKEIRVHTGHIDCTLAALDWIQKISKQSDDQWPVMERQWEPELAQLLTRLAAAPQLVLEETQTPKAPAQAPPPSVPQKAIPSEKAPTPEVTVSPSGQESLPRAAIAEPGTPPPDTDRSLRIQVDHLNKIIGLAGETKIAATWLDAFNQDLLRLKQQQTELQSALTRLSEAAVELSIDEKIKALTADAATKLKETQRILSEKILELEQFERQSSHVAGELYRQAVDCRMRPFSDGVVGFQRMVRDVAVSVGKKAHLEIIGAETQVDREILQKLESPLRHLVRNAVDHGLEFPSDRLALGKPAEGRVTIEARHAAGMLLVTVEDDGRGIDLNQLRQTVATRYVASPEMAKQLSETELLDFLFLPGFSLKQQVTEISGRGFGLDAVQNMCKEVRGTVRIQNNPGKGARFSLQLPLTLSILRSLVVQVGGESYALPLSRVEKVFLLPQSELNASEGRQHFTFNERRIGLVPLSQVLGVDPHFPENTVPIVLLSEKDRSFGLVVDRLLGEFQLVVRPLDPHFGKVKDISAAAMLPDGSLSLILDLDDVFRSIEVLVSGRALASVTQATHEESTRKRKRILVVDDSLTVRELERKLLDSQGYHVDVAVDGMDAWNTLRTQSYDMVVTDIDMPRLDGIELVSLIKNDAHLRTLPVMIVSYKDREEDRRRGLEAGADYYLTKGSFHDDKLIQAVMDLIGGATE